MSRTRRRTRPLLWLALAVAACAPAAEQRDEVVVRAGGPETSPALTISPQTFGTATRRATRMSADSRFEMSLAGPASSVRFSHAVRRVERCPIPVRFQVQAELGAGWRTVHDELVPGGEPTWVDRSLDLRGLAPEASRFAFTTRAEFDNERMRGSCLGRVEPFWGSVTFLGAPAETATPAVSQPPDGIVLISLDTLSARDLSGFGNAPGVSPRLDAWMSDAFSFRRAISQYGHTRPSHASLFSGLYPHHHGASPENLLAQFPSLVPHLAAAGYWTASFTEGAYLSASLGYATGFDEYDDGRRGVQTPTHTDAARTFTRAADWLERHGDASRFFLFIHTYEVHIPYTPRDPEARAVARRLSPGVDRFFTPDVQLRTTLQHSRGDKLLSEDELAHLAALYAAEIQYLDRVVDGFLTRLAALEVSGNTLVVVTADHGDQFGEQGKVTHGESLHNRVHHVPLAFRWPGRIEPGSSADPVELIDVLPTILELTGAAGAPQTDGESLLPWLLDRGDAVARPAFSELPTAPRECGRLGLPFRCALDRYAVQTGRFKLERSAVPPFERLYDLERDPREERDVSEEHPDELARHRALLQPFSDEAERSWRDHGPAARVPLDDELREQLQALGYAE